MVNLVSLFNHLGEKSEGQLKWVEKDKTWTQWILQCFDDYMGSNHSVTGISNYMGIDRVWRDSGLNCLILALEHENKFDREGFLDQEIQHLIDLKATCKVAITYPQHGEEEETIKEICDLISRNTILSLPQPFQEEYLIIFGFATRKEGQSVILWKGYTINNVGKLLDTQTKVVVQASNQNPEPTHDQTAFNGR